MSKKPRTAQEGVPGLQSRDAPGPPSLLDRLWFRLLAAAWVLAIVLIYYYLTIDRLLQVGAAGLALWVAVLIALVIAVVAIRYLLQALRR